MDKVKPIFRPTAYDPSAVIRLANPRQIASYMANGLMPLDIYASRDPEKNHPVIIAIFDREASKEYFDKWCNHELT